MKLPKLSIIEWAVLLFVALIILLTIIGEVRSDEYEETSRIIWEQDTGNIRYEYEWEYEHESHGDCASQPDRSPVAEAIEEDRWKDEYKDWLREQDVEEGLLVGW